VARSEKASEYKIYRAMNKNPISLSPQVLQEIEEALNIPLFFGIPVGAILNDTLISALYVSHRDWSWRARMKNLLRYFYQRFHQPAYSSKDFSQYAGRIVFTWLFDRTDLKAFVSPLLENYGSDASVVVVPYASMQAKLPVKTESVAWSEFPKIDMREWRREFDRCVPVWRHHLYKVMERHSIPCYVAEYLLCRLQIQTKRILASSKFLDMARPKVIVTEYDRSGMSSCLLLSAKQKGIPAVTMIHGTLEPYPAYGFFPTLASYICCWGVRHKHHLLDYGVNEKQLVVTGSQATSKTLGVSSDVARLKVGVPVEKPVVLFSSTAIKPEYKMKNALVFCDAMSQMTDVTSLVRIHPAENIVEYQELIDKFPKIIFLSNDTMSRDESIAAADIIVSHESSYGVDAILKGKLVLVLDVLDVKLKIGLELIKDAGCPRIKNSSELRLAIHRLLTDEKYRKKLHATAKIYARESCDCFGHDAVKNVCQVIDCAAKMNKLIRQ
jgi:hypothetical protein